MSAYRNGSTGKKHGVAITGIGAITPIGHGAEGLWEGIRDGFFFRDNSWSCFWLGNREGVRDGFFPGNYP